MCVLIPLRTRHTVPINFFCFCSFSTLDEKSCGFATAFGDESKRNRKSEFKKEQLQESRFGFVYFGVFVLCFFFFSVENNHHHNHVNSLFSRIRPAQFLFLFLFLFLLILPDLRFTFYFIYFFFPHTLVRFRPFLPITRQNDTLLACTGWLGPIHPDFLQLLLFSFPFSFSFSFWFFVSNKNVTKPTSLSSRDFSFLSVVVIIIMFMFKKKCIYFSLGGTSIPRIWS